MIYNFNKNNSFDLEKKNSSLTPIATVIINCATKDINKIKQTVLSVANQTREDIEIIIIGDVPKEIKKYIELDSRIKIVKTNKRILSSLITKISKSSEYFTIIDSGEELDKTYLETSIVSLQLKPNYFITYTDTANYNNQRVYNYLYENKVLYDYSLPVPNLVFNREVLKEIANFSFRKVRTWKIIAILINKYNAIHQSYYGFITYKQSSDLNDENKEYLDRLFHQADIINYPEEKYYHEMIKSNLNKLTVEKKKKEKTNILMIIPWMIIGGADKFNLDFVRLINHDQYEVTILTDHPKEYIWRQEFEKYTEAVFEMPSFIDRSNWPTFMEYIIKSRNIDMVLISNSITGYNFVPYLKLLYPKLPIIDYIHSVELYNRNGGYGRDSYMMSSLINKTLFCSKDAENMFKRIFKEKRNTKTIYIGVDSLKFSPSEEIRQEAIKKYKLEDTINIGYICRIDYPKRPLLLAEIIRETVSKNSNIKFIVGGEGPLLNGLKDKIKKYNLEDKVLFLGNIDDPVEFYSVCDITVNCSIKEGLALTAYESMSMGVPIVSADVGGHRELITKDCGILVPLVQREDDILNFEYSEEEIIPYVKGINKIINNLEYYKKNCRKRITKNFSLSNMISSMQSEIDDVINNPNEEIINNAKMLKNNKNIIYEYLNNYLMGSQYEYQTLINRYYNSFREISVEGDKNNLSIRDSINRFFVKIHLINEYNLVKDFIKSVVKNVLFPIRLILIEIKRIIK